MRKIIDLTHTISEDMPVYPGTERPKFQIVNSYEKDGFRETLITMNSHTGTHMDAPLHMYEGRIALNQFPVSNFVGSGLVINCTDLGKGRGITMEQINGVKTLADKADFLLFYLGWDTRWDADSYFEDFPYITGEVAKYIIDSGKKGLGVDAISIDPMIDPAATEHSIVHKKLFLNSDIVIIENLCNLGEIGSDLFTLCALPIKYLNADGAPVRAIAILN